MYSYPFSGVVALAKSSNLPLSVCQGVLSCVWVSHRKCLCVAWLTSRFFACWDCLNRAGWLSSQRAVVQISSSALSKSATRLMVRISSWQHLVWWWEVTLFTLGGWRLSQGLPSNFSSVTACAGVPGWFDMQQKMQTVSRASGKSLSPCIQGFLRGQPVGMKTNYLSGRTELLRLGRITISLILQQCHCLHLILVTRLLAAAGTTAVYKCIACVTGSAHQGRFSRGLSQLLWCLWPVF